MPEKPRDYEAELRALMEALAESVAGAPDEEIINETREGGEDPAAAAEEVRAVLRNAVKAYEQRHLREAQKAYEKHVDAIRRRTFFLPTAPADRRKLLTFVMTRKPDLSSALLTLQHRDFKEWTDTDIQKCLEQLGALGVLDEFEGSVSDEQ
jgi:hypothetical protein